MHLLNTIQKHSVAFVVSIVLILGLAFFLIRQNNLESNNPITNNTWHLSAYYDEASDSMINKVENSEVTLKFADNNRVMGNGGCNSYTAVYEINKNKITIRDIESTLMACEETSDQEAEYLSLLTNSKGIMVEAENLKLLNSEGEVLLEFQSKE